MSHLTQSLLEQFFELEKESARGVLRKEMDSAMDTIFKQMKRKLMMLLDNVELGNETGHELGDLDDPTDREQQFYESSNDTNHTPTTSTNSQAQLSVLNASNISQQGGLSDQQQHEQPLYSSSKQNHSTSTNSSVSDNLNSDRHDEIIVKNELGELVNIISIPTSSTQPSNQQTNDNDDDLFDELEDEDCDCSECVGDLFVMKEEGDDQDDDDDNSQSGEDLIDESNDTISRPTKRPRLENDQIQDQTQANNQNIHNQYITISLKCSQCSQMFQDRNALNVHLEAVHSIEKYRCLYKDCNRSFDKSMDLARHYSPAHSLQPNTTWPCGYCSGHYKSSHTLFMHYLMHHEDGLFQCAHPDCQFVAELRQTVRNHFWANHKEFVCQHAGCAKRYPLASSLKTHELTHRDARPYRCKWLKCNFAGSAYKQSTIVHIRTHLKKIVKQKSTNISHDPNDYLEVVHEML